MFLNKQNQQEEQVLQIKKPTTINAFVDDHKKWLMKKLYERREEDGDVVFIFKDF